MKNREAILQPFPEKDPNTVEKHPNPSNSAIFVYRYGRLEKIEPATPENLNIYEPELPPKFYKDETINRKPLIDKPLPEGKFASGASPFIQAVLVKAHEMEERGEYPAMGDFYKSVAKEFKIAPEGDETRKMVKGIVGKISEPGGPAYLMRYRGKYTVGNDPELDTPFHSFRRRVDPIKDKIMEFLESRDMASYEEIKNRIMGRPMRWLSNVDYLDKCLEELHDDGYVDKIDDKYRFKKRLEPFAEEE